MQINLSELISTDYKVQDFSVPIELTDVTLDGECYPLLEKQPFQMTVRNDGRSVLSLVGMFDITLDIPCSRCLTSVPTKIMVKFDQAIDFNRLREGETDDIDETGFIEENSLDVDRFVHNEILIHFPTKTLCQDGCRGLCIRCGANLNQGECGCDRVSQDPRMSAIRDIFNNYKEV